MRGIDSPVVSSLARVEVPAAIWRKHRLGELSDADAGILVDEFERDWFGGGGVRGVFAVLGAGAAVLEAAARAVVRHQLRAYDAVQLAAALEAREADPDLVSFACFDLRLAEVARREGFRVLS